MAVIAALVAAVHGEAEAEADPAVLYGGYYGYPYGTYGTGVAGVAGVKSAPCVNAANVPVPCAAGRKRREAEAEAEADPAVLYGGYYGYPSAYNRFAYGYGYGLGGYYGRYAGYYGHPYAYYGAHGVGVKSAPCVNAANVPVPCA